MTPARILHALRTAAPGSPELLDAIERATALDWYFGEHWRGAIVDEEIMRWDRGERGEDEHERRAA